MMAVAATRPSQNERFDSRRVLIIFSPLPPKRTNGECRDLFPRPYLRFEAIVGPPISEPVAIRWPTDRTRLLVTGTRKSRQHGVHVNDATPRRTRVGPEPPARSRSENTATLNLCQRTAQHSTPISLRTSKKSPGTSPATLPAAQRHTAGHRVLGSPAVQHPPSPRMHRDTLAQTPRRQAAAARSIRSHPSRDAVLASASHPLFRSVPPGTLVFGV